MATFPAKIAKKILKSEKLPTTGKEVKRVRWISAWKEDGDAKVQQSSKDEAKDNIFIRYCDNTTVHGIRYLSHRGLHWTER